MKLTIIGCSGSFPGPESPASCYLLSAEHEGRTWRIILDLGNGALGKLQQHTRLEDLDAVCLSHLHPDHYMDLCGLHVAVRWRPGGWPGKHLPVYGPSTTAQRIASAYGLDLIRGCIPTSTSGSGNSGGRRPWAPSRSPRSRPGIPSRRPMLRVEAAGEDGGTVVLAYSGDTDACEGLVEAAEDADLFLCEAAFEDGRDDHLEGIHLNGARAGQMAAQAGAERVLLTHIPVWTSHQVVLESAKEEYDGDLAVAVGGVTYDIS